MQNKLCILITTILLSSSVFASSIVVPQNTNKSTIVKDNSTSSSIVSTNNGSASIINTTQNTQLISQKIAAADKDFQQNLSNIDKGLKLIDLYMNDENISKYKYRNATKILYILSQTTNIQNYNTKQQEYIHNLDEKVWANYNKNPNNPHNLAIMSGLSMLFSDKTKTMEYAQQAKSLNPQIYTFLVGYLYFIDGNYNMSKETLQEAAKLDPRDTEIQSLMNSTLSMLGNYQEVKNNSTSSSIVSTNNGSASIINTTQNTQDISQQIIEYENYVNQHPENFDNGIKLIELYLNNPTPSKYKYRSVTTTLYLLSTEKKFQDLNEYQQQYIRNLNENALKEFKEQPNNPHNLAMMSGLSALFDNKDKAYEYAQKAQSISPQLYTFSLGHLYLLDGNIEKSKQLFTEALKYNPKDNEIYLWLMQTQYLSGNYKETIKIAKYLLPYKHLRYTYTVFFYLRANDKINKDDSEFVADIAPILQKQATEKDKIYTELACIYISFGAQETVNLLESKAIEANPNRANTYLDLAEAYLKVQQTDKVKELLSQAQRLIDTKEEVSKYNLISAQINGNKIIGAKELMDTGLYEDAIKVYSNSANPNSLDALLGIATCYQYLGNKEKALIYYNKAMSMYPDNADVYYAFAFYFSNNNDNETARKYLNNALRLNPRHKEAQKLANHLQIQKEDELMDIAFAYFDSKEYPETIETLNKILALNQNNVAALYYKGLTYISMENYQGAINEFLKVTKLAPQYSLVYYSLGIAYDNINEKTEAAKYYTKYVNTAVAQTQEEQSYIEYAKSRIQKLTTK